MGDKGDMDGGRGEGEREGGLREGGRKAGREGGRGSEGGADGGIHIRRNGGIDIKTKGRQMKLVMRK